MYNSADKTVAALRRMVARDLDKRNTYELDGKTWNSLASPPHSNIRIDM